MIKKRFLSLLVLLAAVATGARADWTGETYTATANENLGAITVTADATLTINEDVTVTVTGGINVASGTLTVTGPGTLVVTGVAGSEGKWGQPGGSAISGAVAIYSGTITATGGKGGNGTLGDGGNGGAAFAGTLTYYGGTVNANGGDGGSGNTRNGGMPGNPGKAFANDVDFTQTTGYSVTNGTSTIGSALNQTMVVISGGTPIPTGYSVSLKESTEDATSWQGKAGEGEYQALPLEGVAAGTAVSFKYFGTKKVESVKAVKKVPAPEGAIDGKFSVSATKQVYFSKGNLRYASGAWSFFDNQYDYYTSNSADTWDKFCWSISATTYGMNTSTDDSDYYGDFVDWGSNSDLQTALGTGWFTLSSAEWNYLFKTRSASTVGGTSNGRYAKAKVNDVKGVILFPDTYTHPGGVTAPTGVNATGNTGWNGNNYSSADWTKMESAGCVFLPAAGKRYSSSVGSTGTNGFYWSATPYDTDAAYDCDFGQSYLSPAGDNSRYYGSSVRLVRQVTE